MSPPSSQAPAPSADSPRKPPKAQRKEPQTPSSSSVNHGASSTDRPPATDSSISSTAKKKIKQKPPAAEPQDADALSAMDVDPAPSGSGSGSGSTPRDAAKSKKAAKNAPSSKKTVKNRSTFRPLEYRDESRNPSNLKPHTPRLEKIAAPHVESFNSIFAYSSTTGSGLLDLAVKDIARRVVFDGDPATLAGAVGARNKLEMWISNVSVAKPMLDRSGSSFSPIYPSECRERGISYRGKMVARLSWRCNGGPIQTEDRTVGYLPIMVKSIRCNLEGNSPKQLVNNHEAPDEFGGYFIVNGIERLIRLLIVPRRNHAIAIIRPSFQKRGPTYSHYGVSMRCGRPDQTSQTITVHYLTDGAVNLRFSYMRQEYMVPLLLVLRALKGASDREVFDRVTMGKTGNTFVTDRVELLLRSFQRYGVFTQQQCLAYIGSKFHVMLDSPEDSTQEEVGSEFLKRIILVHLTNDADKFDVLIFLLQKLYALVAGECAPDNPDSPQHQEVLMGGHLYNMHIKEKLAEWLDAIKLQIRSELRRSLVGVDLADRLYISRVLNKTAPDIGQKMQYFLATGNLKTRSGLDLSQATGYTIVAEKLNFYRYISHFHSIHRGAFFAELKTTTVRKLLPEAWGFLCPVHTPDGSPCGLLNHLSHTCRIITAPVDTSSVPALVASLGVGQMFAGGPRIAVDPSAGVKTNTMDDDDDTNDLQSVDSDPQIAQKLQDATMVNVMLDGRLIGWCTASTARRVARTLRHLKVTKQKNVPMDLEIGFVPPSKGGEYPGLYLFSTPARFMRPVKYLATGETDMVGSFEQVYMDIACLKEDIVPGLTTHIELHPTSILSVVANLTPFSDFNQSPRNMYQCQMGKQTMGTPAQNLQHRTDNKLYRIQTGQTPIVRPTLHQEYGLDGYPHGVNAVVAVIAYTGYDMEDASIISRGAHDRGYGYGSIYKSEFIDLNEVSRNPREAKDYHFGLFASDGKLRLSAGHLETIEQFLDADGLPKVGILLKDGDPLYAYINEVTKKVTIERYKSFESAYVDQVRLIGSDSGDEELRKVHIKLRIPRPAIIGDKFSSRHGQKGVISQKWATADMPFSESGIVPDVIINPHAFPSRMTIGMFVESLAGKSGALHGRAQDATPFQFNEEHTAADHFGRELAAAGFNYHGNEPMYSGITGEEFKADIYIGVVYYQRLRHMVSDKFQVRTTGPVHNLTQQPIKGRKRAGGIRLGEMERDSLLAHGISFVLQDRLMNCSDYTQCFVCTLCGSILSPTAVTGKRDPAVDGANGNGALSLFQTPGVSADAAGDRNGVTCLTCKTTRGIDVIAMPFVFRYLCAELVAMNVRLKLEVQ
ncbi:hypothetical protein DFJ73DRAFT_640473 [Zopfochytrium polystomum]|nr:hypothetical protein DFJ73DRAFT_640473 [Zopfochytrium polystomum]